MFGSNFCALFSPDSLRLWIASIVFATVCGIAVTNAQEVSGELRCWHPVTLSFAGPASSEAAPANPFLDYRLNVTFTHRDSSEVLTVPGYYAADGDAAESSAISGSVWRVRFSPTRAGLWDYSTSFRSGIDLALSLDPAGGIAAAPVDGVTGTLDISASDKVAPDFRGKGFLRYVGDHYYQFDDGSYFLKGGPNSPENFLAYYEFDNTVDHGGVANDLNGSGTFTSQGQTYSYHGDGLHHYDPHLSDWNSGDPTWKGDKGKRIIGAVNYLASRGVNSMYFLSMNVRGDGDEVFPWTGHSERLRFDVSKLAQWDIVFSQMTKQGVKIHLVTQETENDRMLDGGELGRQRKLYYRELVARFAHHPALVWNLGEENTNTTEQLKAFSDYIRELDPYDHPITLHTAPGQHGLIYTPLLGFENLSGLSLQNPSEDVHSDTKTWVARSAEAGHPWAVAFDEIGTARLGVPVDTVDPNHNGVRTQLLWGNLMASGAGVEYYFGFDFEHSDLTCEDFRARENMWDQNRIALDFFQSSLPFSEMVECDELVGGTGSFGFRENQDLFAVYTATGGSPTLSLSAGSYNVVWFDPKSGGATQSGTVASVTGPGVVSLGAAPFSGDALAVVSRMGADVVTAVASVAPEVVVLPDNTATLDGASSSGQIATYSWTKVSGPTATIVVPGSATTSIVDLSEGQYVFRLTVMGGGVVDSDDVTLTVNSTPAAGLEVTGFTLINADTNQAIGPLADGDVLNLATLPTRNLNVRADVSGQPVGSVVFAYDGNPTFQTESTEPYALSGERNGNYDPWTPSLGNHSLAATPFSAAAGGGDPGLPRVIRFEVIDRVVQRPQPPTNIRIIR